MRRILLFLVLITFPGGCSTYSYLRVTRMSEAQLRTVSDMELCNAYAHTRAEPHTKQAPIRRELEARDIFTQDQWELIRTQKLQVGISDLMLVACRGYPKRMSLALQETDEGEIRHAQYIYEGAARYTSVAVYVRDGVVTGWREWSDVQPGEFDPERPAIYSVTPSVVPSAPATEYRPEEEQTKH